MYLGMYVGLSSYEEGELFVTEGHCFSALIEGLASPCPSCVARNPWRVESLTKVRLQISIICIYVRMNNYIFRKDT